MELFEIRELLTDGNYLDAIKILNDLYRQGTPLVTDVEYDSILEYFKQIDPTNELFKSGVIETVEVYFC